MQGKNENLLSSADKIRALQGKLKVWSIRIQEGNSDMFFHFSKTNNKKMVPSIIKHLSLYKPKLRNIFQQCPLKTINGRGGVEDTRLEAKAKAKDTKKIRGQGQGQPFRGQNLSRPRTGMLEAKAKDQGHRRKCSPKKKSSKIFFRRSPIRWRTQNLLG